MSAHSAGAYTATLLVMVNVMKGGGRAHPHPHQPGLILPSLLNVRQKAAVATLCTLWVFQPQVPSNLSILLETTSYNASSFYV